MFRRQSWRMGVLGTCVVMAACDGSSTAGSDGAENQEAGLEEAGRAEDGGPALDASADGETGEELDAGQGDGGDAGDGVKDAGEGGLADGAHPDVAVEADGNVEPPLSQLSVVPLPANSLARWVDYRTEQAVETDVWVRCGADYDQRFHGPASDTHSVFVMGLVADSSCEVEVFVDDEVQATEAFDVLGPAGWPSFSVETQDESAMEPGWTLLNVSNSFDSVPARVALVDAAGRLRWYLQLPTTQRGADTEVARVQGGVMACGRLGRDGPLLVGWDGSVLWQPRLGGHHDCRFVDAEETVLRVLLDGARCAGEPGAAVIQDIDRATGAVLWDWAMCEHYTPAELVEDWSHVNTIESFPGEEALLLSSREQHALFKVDHATGEVVWKLGLDGDFSHDPADAFWAQHAPEVQGNGHILLFDNGRDDPDKRASSRVIEIAYDTDAMTYEVVWEWEPTPARFNPVWGDADRLPGGTTLATFGARSTMETSDLYEVDAEGTPVWQLQLPARWGVYRADRVEPVYGHVVE